MKNEVMESTDNSARKEFIVFLLIQAAVFAVYFKAFSYGFMVSWDDPAYVVNNAAAHGFSWENIKSAFTRFYVGNYAPLHIVSYMLDYTLWGLNPAGYVSHNIFLHALNGYLFYILLRKLSLPLYPSILSALLFVLHPVQVESVVWISQRKNLLSMLFFLLSVLFYSSYKSSSDKVSRSHYALSLLFFASALLAKSVVVVLPATLLLYDVCISRRKVLESFFDKVPFIILAVVTSFIALLSQSEEYGGGGRAVFHGGGAWATLLTMLPVFVSYVKMVLIPANLSIVYAPEIKSAIDADVLLSTLIICFLAIFGYWLYRRNRPSFFWYAFIPLALLPVSQIIPLVTIMNDRYLYFPMLGVAACFGISTQYIIDKTVAGWKGALSCCLFLIVALFGVISFQRTKVWKNAQMLWQDASEKQPGSAAAWLVLGELHENQKNPVLAVEYIERALDICKGVECLHAHKKLSILFLNSGDYDRAENHAGELISLFPKSAHGYVLKGYLYYRQKKYIEAEKFFLQGVKLDPNQQSSLIALGNIFLATNRPLLALEKLMAAKLLGNPSPELYYSLACAAALLNKRVDALNYLEQALSLGYNKPEHIFENREFASIRGLPDFARLMQRYFPSGLYENERN